MQIEKAFKDETLLRSIIGIGRQDFDELLGTFEIGIKQYYKNLKPDRQRAIGGGKKGHLKDSRDKLFFILLYIKIYPTYAFAGWLFDTSKGRSFEWVSKFLPILEKALKYKVVLPERKVNNLEELLKKFPEIKELFVDGTERPINRPKKKKEQKKNYSGKKKMHTVKNTIISDKRKKILFLGGTQEGKTHDKKLSEKDGSDSIKFEKWGDTGYIGGNSIFTPKKKTKKRSLTEEEKETNKIISSFRVVVENGIGGIKRFGIVSHKFRGRIYGNFTTVEDNMKDKIMCIASGLHNLTIT